MMKADFIPIREVCRRTGLSRETARKRIHDGEFGDFYFDPTAGTFTSAAGVEKWLKLRMIKVAKVRYPGEPRPSEAALCG